MGLHGTMSHVKALVAVSVIAVLLASCATGMASDGSAGPGSPVTTTGASSDANSYPVFATEHTSAMRPLLDEVGSDAPRSYGDGCHLKRDQHVISDDCVYGYGDGPVVAVIGDSHAAQWLPPLLESADRGELTVVSLTASACPSLDFTLADDAERSNEDCGAWRDAALDYLQDLQPDVIFSSTIMSVELDEGIEPVSHHRDKLAEYLDDMPSNASVVWMADTPRFAANPKVCIQEHPTDLDRCAHPRQDVLDVELASVYQETVTDAGALYVDFTDRICDEQMCGVAIGDLLVYRDAHHLNATFSSTFAQDMLAIVSQAAQ